jgi:peptide chain release factor subunit 3
MSKLNAGAFSFVPGGRSFISPQASQSQPPPPLERPEQIEVPRPAPTISLNIGGTPSSTPAPVTSVTLETKPTKPSRPLQGSEESSNLPSQTKKTDIPVSTSTKPSKTFTTERAKTDTNAIAQEVKAVADRAVLEDLYGTCKYNFN